MVGGLGAKPSTRPLWHNKLLHAVEGFLWLQGRLAYLICVRNQTYHSNYLKDDLRLKMMTKGLLFGFIFIIFIQEPVQK